MRLSEYFLPLLKEDPSLATIISHKLMIRSGMIKQLNSGLYNWLPLGLKVLRNIENVVRNVMDKNGCIELLMPCLQPADLWKESERFDSYGKEMLRVMDRHDNELLFGPTAEEVITDIFRKAIYSYKELPKCFYNIQTKFRDEIRPRFGVMRSREFIMKDAYSFDKDKESALLSYEKMYVTYLDCFNALGVNAIAVKADTGAIGGDLSHEFHIIAENGESGIYYDESYDELIKDYKSNVAKLRTIYAASDEIHNPDNCPISLDKIKVKRGIEVGHIFNFGTKYTKSMNVSVMDNNGKKIYPECGSYGIGISRLVGAIIESSFDEKGIIWPREVAPFLISLINLKVGDKDSDKISEEIYLKLKNKNIEVLYDDTKNSVGSKFACHNLIGIPFQIIIGPNLLSKNMVEIKERKNNISQEISLSSLDNYLGKICDVQ